MLPNSKHKLNLFGFDFNFFDSVFNRSVQLVLFLDCLQHPWAQLLQWKYCLNWNSVLVEVVKRFNFFRKLLDFSSVKRGGNSAASDMANCMRAQLTILLFGSRILPRIILLSIYDWMVKIHLKYKIVGSVTPSSMFLFFSFSKATKINLEIQANNIYIYILVKWHVYIIISKSST